MSHQHQQKHFWVNAGPSTHKARLLPAIIQLSRGPVPRDIQDFPQDDSPVPKPQLFPAVSVAYGESPHELCAKIRQGSIQPDEVERWRVLVEQGRIRTAVDTERGRRGAVVAHGALCGGTARLVSHDGRFWSCCEWEVMGELVQFSGLVRDPVPI